MKSKAIELPEGRKTKAIQEDGDRYLGILEYDDALHQKMKNALSHE